MNASVASSRIARECIELSADFRLPYTRCWLGDLVGTQTGRAYMNAFGDSVHLCSDSLNVRVPSTLGSAVRVAYVHAEGRLFPTYLTNCCHRALPSTQI